MEDGKNSSSQTGCEDCSFRNLKSVQLFLGSKKSVQPKELDVSISLQDSISNRVKDCEGGLEKQITPKGDFTFHHIFNLRSNRRMNGTAGLILDVSLIYDTGWMPSHIVAKDESDNVLGNAGEEKREEAINLRKENFLGGGVSRNLLLLDALVSSLHITFPTEKEWHMLKEKGFLQRIGMQYHWKNRNYKNFDEFLMDMKQSKRKNIRQERKKVSTQNLSMKRLRGYEIKARHWDTFYSFYRNTTDNKWGTPYLTRDFFHTMGSKMGDQVLLVVAEEGDELVAGALNIIGGDTLFGRLWGCHPKAYYPSLHFEACYYQAIEAAIELNLNTVEAGAQGEHKNSAWLSLL
ncbi:hypothetical protein NC651_011943 [Populus alba x Populus x berolinensis]|nr:hypothetical protein NC651_011943 [Populus alba x Populus x berolinensis]